MACKQIIASASASALLSLLAACSSTPDHGSSGATGGGGAGGGTTTSTATGGAGGTTTTSATGGSGAAGIKGGFVSLASGPAFPSDTKGYKASAAFASAPDGSPGVFTTSTFGACEVQRYTSPPVQGTQARQSAGAVTFEGGFQTLTITPDASNKYASATSSTSNVFNGGETIVIKAQGDTVPAFSLSVVAPSAVDLTAPAEPPNQGPLPVDRTADLTFTWTGGGSGDVLAILTDTAGTKLTCTFPSASGEGVIPAAALASLAAGGTGSFAIGAATMDVQAVGDWQILALVSNSLTWNGAVDPQTFTYHATN